ncbi:MAG: enoyl-CoA hydratase [Minisyncoccia bacterium]|jgi:enoyl-CoA hydratase
MIEPDFATLSDTAVGPLLVERHDGVAVLTLNRPKRRNALTSQLLDDLRRTFETADADPTVAVVVLTGTGRGFCAGLDLDELSSTEGGLSSGGVVGEMRGPLPAISKPVLGAINGDAITGGLELALVCDVLLASPEARFADTHTRFAMLPAWGMIARLPARIGTARAMEMSLSGRFVAASEAEAWGLVNRVVPADDLLAETLALAQMIAGNDQGAVAAVAGLYRDAADVLAADAWEREAAAADWWQGAGVDPTHVAAVRESVVARNRSGR